jgi:hypothetical protein
MIRACVYRESDSAISVVKSAEDWPRDDGAQALTQIDQLRHLLRQLQRAQFGRRSEQLDPEQLLLALEDIEQAVAETEAAADKSNPVAARARRDEGRASRGALPAHLPCVEVTIAPDNTDCPCCRAPMHVIGEETSRRLDVTPAQFRVIVTVIGKLAESKRRWPRHIREGKSGVPVAVRSSGSTGDKAFNDRVCTNAPSSSRGLCLSDENVDPQN